MSYLFRVELPGYFDKASSFGYHGHGTADLEPWEGDLLLAEQAARFLDHFVRQNTAELPHIKLEEHVEIVRHTANERALYLGQAHDAPDMSSDSAFATEENRQALERLLKLCSHFQAAGDHVANAKEECLRVNDMKERNVVKLRNQIQRCARVIQIFKRKLSILKDGPAHIEKCMGKLN